MVNGVIFRVEYLILTTKTKMLGRMVFFGVCMCGRFGALMGHTMVGMVDMPIPDRQDIS